MKKKVAYSPYCLIMTSLIFAFMCGIIIYALKQPDSNVAVEIIAAMVLFLCLSTLFYMPISLTVRDGVLHIYRPLKVKNIPLSEIADVRLCQPTMGAVRICGSGGFFGWYGWFREKDIGRYFAYYGRASDCFLVTLKSGRKYMLGCKCARDMVKAIKDSSTNRC